jgi:hypothetical protein
MLKIFRVLVVLGFFVSSNAIADDSKLVLFYDMQKGERIIYINAKPVKFQNSLRELGKEIRARGRHAEVITLFEGHLSFNEYGNIRGLLEKVGFLNVTYYHIGETKKRMAKIEPTRSVVPIPESLIRNLPPFK